MNGRKRVKKYMIKTIYERWWASKISNCNGLLFDVYFLFVVLMQILLSHRIASSVKFRSSSWFDLTIFKWESLYVTQWTEQTISMILIWSILQDEVRLIEFYGPISWCDSWQCLESAAEKYYHTTTLASELYFERRNEFRISLNQASIIIAINTIRKYVPFFDMTAFIKCKKSTEM